METKIESTEQIIKPSHRLQHGFLWGVLIAVIVGLISVNIWSAFQKKPAGSETSTHLSSDPAIHNQVPSFSLITQSGTSLTHAALHGKIWVADFIFTNCVTICPLMTDEMAKLQKEFAADDVHFISFSVDPERDTPEVLSRYAARFGVDHDRWSFLTGEKGPIYQLAHEGFNLAAGHQGSEILHSTRFALVDQQGQVRGYYDSRSKPQLQKLRKDIKALLRSEQQ